MRRSLATVCLLLFALPIFAQAVRLSAEQQRMLEQLPPAQRQQALNAIRQIQSTSTTAAPGESINEPLSSTIEPAQPDVLPMIEVEPAATSGSRLVIAFTPGDDLLPDDEQALQTDPALQKLIGTRLFVLDDTGVLELPGIERIPLLGLSKADIERRLRAVPDLSVFDIEAFLLAQEPIGVEALRPFGYDVFTEDGGGMAAPSSGPVPPDYVLGPGDTVRVQLFGNVNDVYEYEVTRDGILNLPEIGPVTVAGIPFSEFRADLDRRVGEMLIGTQVSVSMGPLKTIRVYVVGDVNRPGSYVVGGLATVSSALYSSGGVSEIGSLRNIQLKRDGRVVSRFDVYGLLTRGDTSGDARLQQGDVIFVPPIGNTVSVAGAVKRPAIYEYRGAADAADAVMLAGGLTNEAFGKGARLERINEDGSRAVIAVDLGNTISADTKLRSGDTLLVPEVLPDFDAAVTLTGHVYRPGTYPWQSGMRLTDLIRIPNELKPGVDMNYVLVRRERERGGQIEALSADLANALAAPGSAANIELQARDRVLVFSRELGRQRMIEPILEELETQSRTGAPKQEVSVSGFVKAPGRFPLETGMTVKDLIRAGGGLAEEAYTLGAEVARYAVVDDEYRNTEVIDVDLGAVLRGDEDADLALQEHDNLRVSRVPDWDVQATVELEGEVKFPGAYRIRKGETLRDVLKRAGGLTIEAFPEGAIFLREALREREQQQINTLAERLEADLTSLSLETIDTSGAETLSTGQTLLTQLRSTQAVGRLVIDLKSLADSDDREVAGDIVLREGDNLLVPRVSQAVTVIGQTQQNASHLYKPGLSLQDYIDLSGGLTRRADKKLIYVVRASGAVVTEGRSRWLGRSNGMQIRPGDTIVVPIEIDKIRPLELWTSVTQILYQAGIAVAAVNSFNN